MARRERTTNDDLNDHACERLSRGAEPAPPIGVGSRIWVLDPNRRRYSRPEPGQLWRGSKLIFRASWVEWFIVGANRVSWLLARSKQGEASRRVAKVDFDDSTWRSVQGYAATELELEDRVWLCDNTEQLVDCVRKCRDARILRQVADLVGYEEPQPLVPKDAAP